MNADAFKTTREASHEGPPRVCVIGARRLQNELVASFLERELGVRCLIAGDIRELPQQERRSGPQLLLLDCQEINLKNLELELGSEAFANALSRHYVALFDVSPEAEIEEMAVSRGMRGIFYEWDSAGLFIKGVRAVLRGELWFSRAVMTRYIQRHKGIRRPLRGAQADLTPRELEILSLITLGATNDEIADKLCISTNTVKTHLYKIFKKVKVQNRHQAAIWAANNL